jgi:hypothetical protein
MGLAENISIEWAVCGDTGSEGFSVKIIILSLTLKLYRKTHVGVVR